jgi:hypothetical protein
MKIQKREGVFDDRVDGRLVVCSPETGLVFELNEPAALVYGTIDGAVPEDVPYQSLARAYPDASTSRLDEVLVAAVNVLIHAGIIIAVEATDDTAHRE